MKSTAAIHVAKKQLGLDDESYRAICLRITGKPSSSAMTEGERLKVIDEFRRQGFKPASKASRKRLEGKYAAKLQALWIAGWNLGAFDNRADQALLAFVKRQTGIDHVRFLHNSEDARTAIEGLKKWIERKAGPVWTGTPSDWSDGHKIAATQWSLLAQSGRLPEPGSFPRFVSALCDVACELDDCEQVTALQWQAVMNELGNRLRNSE